MCNAMHQMATWVNIVKEDSKYQWKNLHLVGLIMHINKPFAANKINIFIALWGIWLIFFMPFLLLFCRKYYSSQLWSQKHQNQRKMKGKPNQNKWNKCQQRNMFLKSCKLVVLTDKHRGIIFTADIVVVKFSCFFFLILLLKYLFK